MCKLLEVPRSSYYEQRSRRPSRRTLVNAILRAHIRAKFNAAIAATEARESHGRFASETCTQVANTSPS